MPQTINKYCLFLREDLAVLKDDFFNKDDLQGMKADTYMYKELRNFLRTKGIDLNTQYINKPEESEVIICLNETEYFLSYKRNKTNRLIVLILTEPPVYNFVDWNEERHVYFDKVLSYDSDLLTKNPLKYKQINYPIDLNTNSSNTYPSETEFKSKKLSSLIAGSFSITTSSPEKKSLLFERYKILKWFNKNRPDELDYFSRTNPVEKFKYFRGASLLNRTNIKLSSKIAEKLFNKRIQKVYRGSIPSLDKNVVMAQYKFNFCLENSYNIKGLISEKIFDCFMAKTIPIYFGASDIENYIPKNCFVSYSDFKTLGNLYLFLKQMDYTTYLHYLESASRFLETAKDVFSTAKFIETIYKEIMP